MIYVTCTHKYTDARPKESLGHLPVLHDGGNNQNLADRPRRPKPKIDPSDSVVTFHPQMRYSFTYTQYDRCAMQTHVVPLARYKYIVNYLGTLNVCRTQILPNVCAPDTKYDFTPSRNSST